MPLKLIPPRPGRSKNYTVRGTWLRVYLDRSTGTGDRRLARQILERWKADIESGELRSGESAEGTFAAAALAYMKAGGERRFMAPLLKHFGQTQLDRVDQAAIEAAAAELYPGAAPATRNRQVHTPIAAVLRHADPEHALRLRRPKMPKGRIRFLKLTEAKRLVAHAGTLRPLLVFLLYTGCRLGEAIKLEWETVDLRRRFAFVPRTKNGEPRGVHLPAPVVAELAGADGRRGRVFGLSSRWRVYKPWAAMCKAAGITDFTPHDCRHTWATWMRQYAGADTKALVDTGAWLDEKSAARYQHVVASSAARSADRLPGTATPAKRGRGGK